MKALNIIKFLCETWCGSDPETLLILYKSLVRSHIDYGCFVYFLTRKDLREKLEKIQYSTIRSTLGYRISTPTNILIAESKLPLIQDRTRFLCNSYLSKVLTNTCTQINKTINQYYLKKQKKNRLLKQCIDDTLNITKNLHIHNHYDIYSFDFETVITSIPINTKIGKHLKQNVNPNTSFNKFISKHNSYTIYTDGSKVNGSNSVGTACICQELNIIKKRNITNTASVFTAECIALNDALDIALLNPDHNFKIFSNSLSALLCLQNPKIDIKTNSYIFKIRKKYNEFKQKSTNSNIELLWIPSHIGIQGNEKADILAKTATVAQPDNGITIPFTDFHESLEYKCNLSTKKYIKEQGQIKGKDYFKYYYKNNNKPWFANKGLSQESIVTINRCRSDHYNLAASLSRVGIIKETKCECNANIQDLNHIVWQCPLFDTQRLELVEKLKKCKLYLPLDIRLILSKPNIEASIHVYHFLKRCNLQI
ncbi:uncharacterized protein LOC115242419 [Formica exsecta]|uniref:uncharacterized protein LOC115242419 n=1 Tax=Formica exsecta TaxID=72781 RepID=UPI0011450062|nr:uncharacterized protein LOC115242419 [Formica exsecta]